MQYKEVAKGVGTVYVVGQHVVKITRRFTNVMYVKCTCTNCPSTGKLKNNLYYETVSNHLPSCSLYATSCLSCTVLYTGLQRPHEGSHGSTEADAATLGFKQRCRKRAATDTVGFREIYAQEQLQEPCPTVTYAQVESSMRKRRSISLPVLPKSADDVARLIETSPFAIVNGTAFYRGEVSTQDGSAYIFASDAQLALLNRSSNVQMDATFKVTYCGSCSTAELTATAFSVPQGTYDYG